jgi:hypothetical protein
MTFLTPEISRAANARTPHDTAKNGNIPLRPNGESGPCPLTLTRIDPLVLAGAWVQAGLTGSDGIRS